MKESNNVKIFLTLPKTHLSVVQEAIHKSGAGVIGKYSHCSIVQECIGYSKPLLGSNPYMGKINEIERIEEYLIQFICEKNRVKEVIEDIKKIHPYEEIAFDIYPLLEIN